MSGAIPLEYFYLLSQKKENIQAELIHRPTYYHYNSIIKKGIQRRKKIAQAGVHTCAISTPMHIILPLFLRISQF
jgi:hypothetical protein